LSSKNRWRCRNQRNGFEIIGIAKKNEEKGETIDKVYKPGRKNPISFGREGDLLPAIQTLASPSPALHLT